MELPAGYRAVETIGQGGQGLVLRAIQVALGRPVILKLLQGTLESDSRARSRFQREATILANLKSPYVLSLLDHGVGEGRAYLVYPDEGGRSLDQVLRDRGGRLPATEVETLARQALLGLQEAHALGVVHRDIKPANLLITDDGSLRVIDFGLAGYLGASGTFTRAGTVAGTPAYLAADRFEGADAAPHHDLYALGVVVHEVLRGEPPFQGRDVAAVMTRHAMWVPPRLEAVVPEVSTALSRLVESMLAKSPAGRPRDAEEALARLGATASSTVKSPPAAPCDETRSLIRVTSTAPLDSAPPGAVSAPGGPRVPPERYRSTLALVALVFLGGAWLRRASTPRERTSAPPVVETRSPVDPMDRLPPAAVAGSLADDLEGALDIMPPGGVSTRKRIELAVQLPALRAFLEWIEFGGHPESLPARDLVSLEATGRSLEAMGVPSPYAPFLGPWVPAGAANPVPDWQAIAAAREAATSHEMEVAERALERAVASGGSEARPLIQALGGVLQLTAQIDGRPFPRLRQAARNLAILDGGVLDAYLEQVRICSRAAGQMIYAIGRAAREDATVAERLAATFLGTLAKTRGAVAPCLLLLRPESLLGGPPRTPASCYLHALLLEEKLRSQEDPTGSLRLRRRSLLDQAARGPVGGGHANSRFEQALSFLAQAMVLEGDFQGVADLLVARLAPFDGAYAPRRARMVATLLEWPRGRIEAEAYRAYRAQLDVALRAASSSLAARLDALAGEGRGDAEPTHGPLH